MTDIETTYSSTVGCRFPTYNRSLRRVFFFSWVVSFGSDMSSGAGKDRNGVFDGVVDAMNSSLALPQLADGL
jgi:hypothetical protein